MRRLKRLRWIGLILMLAFVCVFSLPSAAEQAPVAPKRPVALAASPVQRGIFGEKPWLVRDQVPFLDATFHPEAAEGNKKVQIDLSESHLGYVAVSVNSNKRFKFQVIHGDATYTYDVKSDGTPSVFPLQTGDGDYVFRAMENVSGKKYAQALQLSRRVTLDDPFQPFLRPSDYSRYTADSRCVKKATDLAQDAKDQVEIVSAVYAYVNKTVRYDHMKAATVQSGYLPDPDETLKTRRGICFDYASLAAAMLRSQGVPCKVIFGYVAPNQLYHAWNMFYTEETGWVTVSFKANGKDWTRMDLTFTANGQDDTFIGNGSNYTDLYFY